MEKQISVTLKERNFITSILSNITDSNDKYLLHLCEVFKYEEKDVMRLVNKILQQ